MTVYDYRDETFEDGNGYVWIVPLQDIPFWSDVRVHE
jgi:hypothetical protein